MAELVEGVSLREHYQLIWKRSGVKPEALNYSLPDWLRYLWEWFMELHRTRGSGLSGAQPITYAEIAAWASLTERSPSAWEVTAIKLMDAVACKPREKQL